MVRSRWQRLVPILAAVACAAIVSTPAPGESQRDPRSRLTTRSLRGGGTWQGRADTQRPALQWDIDLTRADDDSLFGRVTVVGSPLLQSGTLSGTIEGRRVAGSVTDEAGNHVATFVGTISASGGLQGTYQDRTGEVGRWSWDGHLPR